MASQSPGGGQTEQSLDAIREKAAQWIICLDQVGPTAVVNSEARGWRATHSSTRGSGAGHRTSESTLVSRAIKRPDPPVPGWPRADFIIHCSSCCPF